MSDEKKYVKVSAEFLAKLLNRDTLLSALECEGVKTWEGYSSAKCKVEPWSKEEVINEFSDKPKEVEVINECK